MEPELLGVFLLSHINRRRQLLFFLSSSLISCVLCFHVVDYALSITDKLLTSLEKCVLEQFSFGESLAPASVFLSL